MNFRRPLFQRRKSNFHLPDKFTSANASRGPVVDEKALVAALREKLIFGAGLDVFENEPALEPGLTDLDNVIIVPHVASATPATRIEMGNIVVANIRNVLSGLAPVTCVNPAVLKS